MQEEIKLKDNEFRCANCGKVYEKDWSDEEAEDEAKEIWGVGNASTDERMSVICDSCFNLRAPEDIRAMGQEFKRDNNHVL